MVTFSAYWSDELGKAIDASVLDLQRDSFPMWIKNNEEWQEIANAVNIGIDSHLEALTESIFDANTGKCEIALLELKTLVRRLFDQGEAGEDLAMSICSALEIELI